MVLCCCQQHLPYRVCMGPCSNDATALCCLTWPSSKDSMKLQSYCIMLPKDPPHNFSKAGTGAKGKQGAGAAQGHVAQGQPKLADNRAHA